MNKGLYIHIPFCKKKCLYCNFGTTAFSDKSIDYAELTRHYLKALKEEIKYYSGNTIKTIYIGGGTPTILEGEQIAELLNFCRQEFRVKPETEISVETNPGTLTETKLRLLKKAGVNRLSLGVQSFNNRLLKEIGRIHNAEEARDNFHLARQIGFSNINIDLIFALPQQTLEDWLSDLHEVVKLAPEHISVYNLTLEEGTELYNRWQGGLVEKASNDLEARMYEEAIRFLSRAGWRHYEIANFARYIGKYKNTFLSPPALLRKAKRLGLRKSPMTGDKSHRRRRFSYPGRECIHNNIYWRNEEYIGIGAGATSYIEGIRYTNIRTPEIYINKILAVDINTQKQFPPAWLEESEALSGKKKVSETIILGLRMREGIKLTSQMEENFSREIKELIQKRLLEKRGFNLTLTHQGLMLADQVWQEFL